MKNTIEGIFEVRKYASEQDHLDGNYYEVASFENTLLLSGINEMLRIFAGSSSNTFSAANTSLGVGDSSTAVVNSQTDLQAATNKAYATSTSVTTGANNGTTNTIIIVALFGSGVANFSWQEFVFKQTATSNICLDRAVSNQSTKIAGQVWTLTYTVTIT